MASDQKKSHSRHHHHRDSHPIECQDKNCCCCKRRRKRGKTGATGQTGSTNKTKNRLEKKPRNQNTRQGLQKKGLQNQDPVRGTTNVYNVGVTPAHLAITPNGKRAYVANVNEYGITGEYTVTVLDVPNKRPKRTIHDASFDEPWRVAINCRGTKAYVTNSASPRHIGEEGTVSIIDIRTNTVSGTIRGFDGPSAIVLSPRGRRAYVTNYGADGGGVGSGNGTTVSVVDLRKQQIIDTIAVSLAPAALALKGNTLYVASYVDGTPGAGVFTAICRRTNRITSTTVGLFGPFDIGLSPDGSRAYVTNFGSNNYAPFGTTVSVVDTRRKRNVHIIKEIDVHGIQPSGIAISHDGAFAYVSCFNTLYAGPGFTNLTPGLGTVQPICLLRNKIVAPTISVGQSPSTVTLAPDAKKLFVCAFAQNTVEALTVPF